MPGSIPDSPARVENRECRWQVVACGGYAKAVDASSPGGSLTDLIEIEKELRRRLLLFTPSQRRALFKVLASRDSNRAEAIAAIWASGEAEELSGLLTDCSVTASAGP